MRIHVADDIIPLAADHIVGYIDGVLNTKEYCTLALSEGIVLNELYRLLISDAYKERIDWSRIHVFWTEEKQSGSHRENDGAQALYANLLSHVNVLPAHLHPMSVGLPQDISIRFYEAILHQYFDTKATTFDLVLLEMNREGHVLSWFSQSPIINETQVWVAALQPPQQQIQYISLTPAIINNAANVLILVSGMDETTIIKEVLEGTYQPKIYSAQIIRPLRGALHWFIDGAMQFTALRGIA